MIEQQKPLWYRLKSGKESAYWSRFKNEGDIGLITKFKGSGDGYAPQHRGPFRLDGMVYTAEERDGDRGKYWTIVRYSDGVPGEDSEEVKAAASVAKIDFSAEREAARQRRIDELAERKLALLERIAMSLEKLARCADEDGKLHFVKESEVA